MLPFAFLPILVCVPLSMPLSLDKRVSSPVVNDGIIMNYALTLEYFKQAFYRYGLSTYGRSDFVRSGFENPFYDNVLQMYLDQLMHVTFWTGALWAAGIEPTVELQYTFPPTDVGSFVTLAGVFEELAISAWVPTFELCLRLKLRSDRYLGLSSSVTDKDYLTASNSILSTSSRHASYIHASLGDTPFPSAFDTPLSFVSLYSLAGPKSLDLIVIEYSPFIGIDVHRSKITLQQSSSAAVSELSAFDCGIFTLLLRVSR